MESISNFFKAIWAAVTAKHSAPTKSIEANESDPVEAPPSSIARRTTKMSELQLATWNKWVKCVIRIRHQGSLNRYAEIAIANLKRYENVSAATGIPAWVIAAIHMRESSFNFSTHLANGDPLFSRATGRPLKTVRVPSGLGPFKNWEEGAIAALKHDRLHLIETWDIVTALLALERFNGLGYRNKGKPSPYIWSFTNQYTSGKYVRDGVYDPNAIDKQCGCAALIHELEKRKVIKVLEVSPG